MKKIIRINENQFNRFIKNIVKESVKQILRESSENYPPEFFAWLKEKGKSIEDKPSWMVKNLYQWFLEETAEKNFTDGIRAGDRQGFRNENGEIEWHGNGTINGWASSNSRWTPQEQ